ncbi:MAG: lamin tail domain-containing protein [Myxococcales bacterium]|nr:lamin tail domain-containing protein [Myxococcales bacterium]
MFEPLCEGRARPRASPWVRALGSIWLSGSAALGGCAREPEACLLELSEGDVVISEIRGPQEGPDSRGEWFELYNASGDRVDLRGLRGVLTNLEGSVELSFLVRESLLVEPDDYVVLGSLVIDEARRPELDYSFNADFRAEARDPLEDEDSGPIPLPEDEITDPRSLFANARFELRACDRLVDRVAYAELPTEGTYSLDGSTSPSADDNDDPSRWCPNATEPSSEGPQTALGRPGSPGEANPACP